MASLPVIENLLNIDLRGMIKCDGMKRHDENRYFHIDGKYYIVKLFGVDRRWMIVDDSDESRKLLKRYVFHHIDDNSEPCTMTNDGFRHWGWMRMRCNMKHKNGCKFDNRLENMKSVRLVRMGSTVIRAQKNLRPDNTSGCEGVYWTEVRGNQYWVAYILIDDIDGVTTRKTKSYNIGVLGYEEAKKHAIIKRHEFEKFYG